MTPTVTIDTDSESGSWARHALLAARGDARINGTAIVRIAAGNVTHVPADQFYHAPSCATCGGRICGCSDAQWVGASHSVHNGEVY